MAAAALAQRANKDQTNNKQTRFLLAAISPA
jgi:hypothetical protein